MTEVLIDVSLHQHCTLKMGSAHHTGDEDMSGKGTSKEIQAVLKNVITR